MPDDIYDAAKKILVILVTLAMVITPIGAYAF